MEIRRSKTVPNVYAQKGSCSARGSRINSGYPGGRMKKARFAAVACLACWGAIWSAGCGGGGGNTPMISIAISTPNGALMMDESQAAPAAPNAIILTAGVGGDTAAKGVTWTFQAKQTCAGSGLNAPNCGTLTTIDAFHVTYTAPAITVATSVIIVATSVTDTKTTQTITLSKI